MRAIVQQCYGTPEVLQLRSLERPRIKDNEVLVRAHAAGVNVGDYFGVRGTPWLVRLFVGWPQPKGYVPGWDVAGRVEAVGAKVRRFREGDAVFGACSRCFAEYVVGTEENLALMPARQTFEAAAAVPTAALTALQGLRDHGKLRQGMRLLVHGAAGGVGTFAVQIAKVLGAEVTAVCSGASAALLRSLGADRVIDYTQQDPTAPGELYDLILDNIGNHSFAHWQRVLTRPGRVLANSGHAGMSYVFKAYLRSLVCRQQVRPFVATARHQDLVHLQQLIEAGQVRAVVEQIYPLEQAAAAVARVGAGHDGKLVLRIQ